LPSTASQMISWVKCSPSGETWTDAPSSNEYKPINCINWYTAFAFCIWDKGRLPTEAEWERAAAGGEDENRLFPWGSAAPDCTYANGSGCANPLPVGSAPAGAGPWGHLDLAGNVFEWTFDYYADWYADPDASGTDIVNLTVASTRVMRGGSVFGSEPALEFRAAARSDVIPSAGGYAVGFRCAR
jgi:formylglycine-generating enzyme